MATLNTAFTSSVALLDAREILDQLIDVRNEESSLMEILDMIGDAKPTDVQEFHNFTEDYLYKNATVAGAEAEPAAGVATDVVISAAADAPIVGETYITPAKKTGLVTAVSGTTVTLKPAVSTETAHEAFTGSEVIAFHSNAYAEGTDVNTMRVSTVTKRSNVIQIFKTSTKFTDLAEGSKVELDLDGDGQLDSYVAKQEYDAYRKHEMDVAHQILLGRRSSGLTDANSGAVNLTRGFNGYINDFGQVQAAASSGTFAVEDLRLLSRKLDVQRAPKEYMWLVGGEIGTKIDDAFGALDELKTGGINYNMFGGDKGKEKAVNMGFDKIHIYDRTYYKKRLEAFDHAEVTASTGHSWPSTSFLLPYHPEVATAKTLKGGGTIYKPTFCMRYLEIPGTRGKDTSPNGRYKFIETGGLATVPTNTTAERQATYMSWQGLDCVGVEWFAQLTI